MTSVLIKTILIAGGEIKLAFVIICLHFSYLLHFIKFIFNYLPFAHLSFLVFTVWLL